MKEMVSESSPSSSSKRSRDPEDEAYLDNFHSHKRYLSEIMASSLNGLSVGESMSENLIESPARSETVCFLRDEISSPYSPMSEDSDDARYSETPLNTSITPSDSRPTSPGSPHRHQRPLNGTSITSYPSLSCTLTAVACSQRQRGSDSEGRFPSSPSDICHSADLRRAALLRSVQMRVHPPAPPSYELTFSPEQEPMQNMEAEEQPCSCGKSLVNECDCQNQQQVPNLFVEECPSLGLSGSELSQEKPCRGLNMNVKEEEFGEEVYERNALGRGDILSSRRSILGGKQYPRVNISE